MEEVGAMSGMIGSEGLRGDHGSVVNSLRTMAGLRGMTKLTYYFGCRTFE